MRQFTCSNANEYYYRVNVVYIDRQGKRHKIRAKVGDNAMYLAHRYNIELEGMSSSVTFYPKAYICLVCVKNFVLKCTK